MSTFSYIANIHFKKILRGIEIGGALLAVILLSGGILTIILIAKKRCMDAGYDHTTIAIKL